MFTGLVEATGLVVEFSASADGGRLRVECAVGSELAPGDSIAVNGVCVTAIEPDEQGFSADLSPVTLRVTTLGRLKEGSLVNLERPVRADARLGGHFVLGHVDGVGLVREMRPDGEAWRLVIELPAALEPLVVSKGSIAVDGISLTVAGLDGRLLTLQIIPFTYSHTALARLVPGDAVNIEGDVLGKYVLRALECRGSVPAAATDGVPL
jgi:riboflavin synthase